MALRILGLDPGETTGWALIEVTKHTLTALGYGVVWVTRAGPAGLVSCTREWLDWAALTFDLRGSGCDVAYEEMVKTYHPTRKEAQEVRGVIREWCCHNKPVDSFAYTPEAVRDQLGISNAQGVKERVKTFVSRALGYTPRGPDHVWDAFGVGMAHAIRIGAWHARINCEVQVKGHAARARSVAGALPSRMTAAEFREMMKGGRL